MYNCYTQCIILHTVYNFTFSDNFELLGVTLRCFVARQLLSRIYALLSVKFPGLKLQLCKKNDKYQVCPPTHLPKCHWKSFMFNLNLKINKINYKFYINVLVQFGAILSLWRPWIPCFTPLCLHHYWDHFGGAFEPFWPLLAFAHSEH